MAFTFGSIERNNMTKFDAQIKPLASPYTSAHDADEYWGGKKAEQEKAEQEKQRVEAKRQTDMEFEKLEQIKGRKADKVGGVHSADSTQVGGTHYKDMPLQPWTVMESVLSHEEFVGFLKGNIIKYSMRQGLKTEGDAEKAQHYIDKLNEVTRYYY